MFGKKETTPDPQPMAGFDAVELDDDDLDGVAGGWSEDDPNPDPPPNGGG